MKAVRIITLAVVAALSAFAQTKNIKLDWQSNNPVGTLHKVEQSNSACATASNWTTLVSNITAKTYTVLNVAPGVYCFRVSAGNGSIFSIPSVGAAATVDYNQPTGLTVTIEVAVNVTVNGDKVVAKVEKVTKEVPNE